MNCGLSNLVTLKAMLLSAALRSGTDDDALITAIGLGVAGLMERHCGRLFQRTVGAQDRFAADRAQYLLKRYPVEALTTLETKTTDADGWTTQTIATAVNSLDLESGIVYLPDQSDAGQYYAQVRFTYTGGFWWDTSEDNSGSLPSGATPLPADLKLAWIAQCQHVWGSMDKIGGAIASGPAKASALDTLELSPLVKQMLATYVRPSWT